MTQSLVILTIVVFTRTAQAATPHPLPFGPGTDCFPAYGTADDATPDEWREARSCTRRLYDGVVARYGADSIEAAWALDPYLEARRAKTETLEPENMRLARQGLAIKERQLGPEDVGVVPSLLHMAIIHRFLGEDETADALLARAVRTCEARLADDPNARLALAETLDFYVYQAWDTGNRHDVMPLLERILRLRTEAFGESHPSTISAIHEIARYAWRLGDDAASMTYIERALAAWERTEGKNNAHYSTSLNHRGILRMEFGDYSGAREDFEAALATRRSLPRPYLSNIGASTLDLGVLAKLTGDYETAKRYFEQAVDVWSKDRGDFDPDVAMALDSVGRASMTLGRIAESRAAYERALGILDRWGGTSHVYYPSVATGLGDLLLRQGRLKEARGRLALALTLSERRYGPIHLEVADELILLARVDEAEGALDAARSKAERVRDIEERILGGSNPAVADALDILARIDAKQKRTGDAVTSALRAVKIRAEHLRLTARALPDAQALRYAAAARTSVDALVALAVQGGPTIDRDRVFDAVIRSRATVIDEMAARHRAVARSDDPAVAKLAADLERTRRRLSSLLLRGPEAGDSPRFAEEVAAATRESERAESSLAGTSLVFRENESRSGAGLGQIRQSLPEGSALVAYARYGGPAPGYAAFVLASRNAPTRLVSLGAARSVDEAVDRWRQAIAMEPPALASRGAGAERGYSAAGGKLRRLLWDPWLASIAAADRVFIVPDDRLSLVNFATLPDGEGHYLIEREVLIHELTAERDLVRAPHPRLSPGSMIAFGGPDYDHRAGAVDEPAAAALYRGPQSSCAALRSLRFDPLPMSAIEAREVVDLWKAGGIAGPNESEVLALTGIEAGETAFKLRAGASRVLHVATHGFFLDGACPSETTDSRRIAAPGENPLLRAGLAFAGANRRSATDGSAEADDGVLTAEEIASLDLSGVEWAVLSACDSGVGEVQAGEGVLGLRRAFEVAGAGTLIMSLWSIGDDSARAWMRALYLARLSGKNTSEAVREAGRRVLSARREAGKGTHPFYWGAFVATGDWR